MLLSLIVLGSGLAILLHWLEPNTHPINLVMPLLNGGVSFVLLLYLHRNPGHLVPVLWVAFTSAVSHLVLVAWYFTLRAAFYANVGLVETLPPVSFFPLALTATMFIFARPRQVLIAAIGTWCLTGLPILTYLVLHPDELLTPRGLEMTLVLGPAMAIISVLISLHTGLERTMTSLQSERSQMQRLSERDPLTQLYNRRGLEKFFPGLMVENDTTIGAILFDIDHFKGINDQYGHSAGDTVLSQVAQRCRAVLRKDDLFARWGGEEFLIVIQGAGDKVLHAIAEDLRQVISDQPINPVGKVTASFGVTRFFSTDSVDSLLQRVDEAMYLAKSQGRDRIVSK